MNKNIVLLIIIFLIFLHIAYSLKTFVIQEGEKLALAPNATDPDADKLMVTYSKPLDENGEWQTTYGDAGHYKATITVSDGINADSQDVEITVNKKEEKPQIDSFEPKQETLQIDEAQSLSFKVSASDSNKDELSYIWFFNSKKMQEGPEFTYSPDYEDAGSHEVYVEVSDGASIVKKEWKLEVENVDVEDLLDSIRDAAVNENDVVKLELPDFEKYGLKYTISEPVGNSNQWKTGYNDAGTYDVRVHAEGKGFSKTKTVKVTVKDVDRPPMFESIESKFVKENEELKIILKADDPDNDEINFSADKLPEGAKLEGNIFMWMPSYDTVKKENFIDNVMDKFRILSKRFYIQFAANSKGKKVMQNIIITVKDANRAPVVEDMEPIQINEGEAFRITPKAYDIDGDKISLKYSGFMGTNTFQSKLGDAGTYYVGVTASDGLLEASKPVKIIINRVNRAPVFGKIKEVKAFEGDVIAILLNAYDPDGDELSYSIGNPPQYSSIKGNAFFWTPDFNVVSKGSAKRFDLIFAASDNKSETRQIVKLEVKDKNRAPKIIDATRNIVAKVNQPVLMFVKATDEDGDALTYTWKFSLLEQYKATSSHQRVFTARGAKTVKVIVSDGTNEVEQIINVNAV